MHCKYCNQSCIKKGVYKQVQKFYCKACHKYQRDTYTYRITQAKDDLDIALLTKESMSISSIARYLQMAKTTVCRRILKIADKITAPKFNEAYQVYEVDEMQTYIGKRHTSCHVYITYAINRLTKTVTGFVLGSRTKETISKLINHLLQFKPSKIYTDGLNLYPSLIPQFIHRCLRYRTNVIERNNLSIRNTLKRLSRKTICFSKSIQMLEACLKICFWQDSMLNEPYLQKIR